MATFQNRPTQVQAVQWFPGKEVEGVVVGEIMPQPPDAVCNIYRVKPPHIKTLEGEMTVSPGDWVITGTHNDRWAVKPHIFKIKYEPIDDEAIKAYTEAYGKDTE